MDCLATDKLLARIAEDLRLGRGKLPSLPDVAFRIWQALKNEHLNAAQLARIVQNDPALAARLLQAANGARYFGSHPVHNLRDAITRLGFGTTRNLATSLALHHAYRDDHPVARQLLQDTWRDSCRVGAIAHVLAALSGGTLQPDLALLGGLTHRIGVLPLVDYVREYPVLAQELKKTDSPFCELCAKVGTMLLGKWQFDPRLIAIPAESGNWLRDQAGQADYVDVVIVARAHAALGRADARGIPPLTQLPAFLKLPISRLGPDASIQILHEARDEIETMSKLLSGP